MNRHCTGSHAPRILEITQRYGMKAASWETVNSHYHVGAAIRVRTNQGDMLIKPFRGSSERLRHMTATLQRLWEQGYRYMPKLYRTQKGQLYTVVGGQPHYVTTWVSGQPLDSTPQHLRKLGRALARLHQVPWSQLENRKVPGVSRRGSDLSSSVLNRRLAALRTYDRSFRIADRAAVRDDDVNAEGRKWLHERQSEIERLADKAWHRLEDPELNDIKAAESIHPVHVHGDVTKFNVVVTPEGSVKLVDWDGLRVGSRWIELVTALSNTAQFDPPAMEALLEGYERVRPLSAPERMLVAAVFSLPREAWYARQEKDGAVVWNDEMLDVFAKTWSARLQAVQWMNRWATRR